MSSREELVQGLRSDDKWQRFKAISLLGQRRCRSATPQLIAALGDADAQVRAIATVALAQIGARTAARSIAELLTDPAHPVRVSAAYALGELRAEEGAIPLIRALRAERDEDVLPWLVRALGRAASHEMTDAVEAVRCHAGSSDPDVRHDALMALAELKAPDANLHMRAFVMDRTMPRRLRELVSQRLGNEAT